MTPRFHHDLALLCQEAYQHDNLHVGGDIQGIIARIQGTNVIALRGTELDFDDILRDLRAFPIWASELGTFGHAGFIKGARHALPVVATFTGPLVLAGHSLGGALAYDIAALLNRPNIAVVTFGEPRSIIGKPKRLPHVLDKRFVNANDIVPRHPWPIWGFRHRCNATKIGGPSEGRFDDHKLSSYLAALKT